MAVGDATSVFVGTGAATYQPSSGVVISITALMKNGGTATLSMYDGTNSVVILVGVTENVGSPGSSWFFSSMNIIMMLSNAVYLSKSSSDLASYHGIQTEA